MNNVMNQSRTIRTYRFVSYLLLLGVIHAALTPLFYAFLSPNGMWFFGTGLTLIFLCMLNIAASRLLNLWLLRFTLTANIIGTVFSAVLAYVLGEPQAYIGLLFHLIVLTACILTINQQK